MIASPHPYWRPPSENLFLEGGLWITKSASSVEYPDDGNDLCLQVEDTSYWFQHRLECIRVLLHRFPINGPLYDIGGGNGQIALALQSAGQEVVLVEPGTGAINAFNHGVRKVIRSSFEACQFHPASLAAVSAFDVVEHICNDTAFFSAVREALYPGGRLLCTVPAGPSIWSHEDTRAGHQRRYSSRSLIKTLQSSGFEIEFCSHLFSWLLVPVTLYRHLPYRLGWRPDREPAALATLQRDHNLPPWLAPWVERVHRWELHRLAHLHRVPCGTSLICVARTGPSS